MAFLMGILIANVLVWTGIFYTSRWGFRRASNLDVSIPRGVFIAAFIGLVLGFNGKPEGTTGVGYLIGAAATVAVPVMFAARSERRRRRQPGTQTTSRNTTQDSAEIIRPRRLQVHP